MHAKFNYPNNHGTISPALLCFDHIFCPVCDVRVEIDVYGVFPTYRYPCTEYEVQAYHKYVVTLVQADKNLPNQKAKLLCQQTITPTPYGSSFSKATKNNDEPEASPKIDSRPLYRLT